MTKGNSNSATKERVRELYSIVDEKNADKLGGLLAEDIMFKLGNHPPIHGKGPVVDANAVFFKTVDVMAHSIDGIWQHQDDVICAGEVRYTRFDKSELSIPFSTFLTLENGLIKTYQVYVDVSDL